MHLAATTGRIWRKGSSGVVITSVGSNGKTALVWGVRKTSKTQGRLVAYRVVVPRGRRSPAGVRDVSIGLFSKFTPPAVGQDEIFVGGSGHVVGFGFK